MPKVDHQVTFYQPELTMFKAFDSWLEKITTEINYLTTHTDNLTIRESQNAVNSIIKNYSELVPYILKMQELREFFAEEIKNNKGVAKVVKD